MPRSLTHYAVKVCYVRCKNICRAHVVHFNPSNAKATFYPKYTDAKIFDNHLNLVMVIFII